MKKALLVATVAVALALAGMGGAWAQSPTCGLTNPVCENSSTLPSTITFVCNQLEVDGYAGGGTNSTISVVTLNPDGTLTITAAGNGTGSTFIGFTSIGSGAKYCVNTANQTGYVNLSGTTPSRCALALVFVNSETQAYLIDTTNQTANALSCVKQ